MIKIRLSRTGPVKKPFYRIVVIDKRKKGNGMPLDVVGYYRPIKKEKKIDKDKLRFWTSKGAKVSAAVEKLI